MRAALVACVALAACGPNAAELYKARHAHYHGPPGELLDGAAAAVESEHYTIAGKDPQTGELTTKMKLWAENGDLETPGPGGYTHVQARNIGMVFRVRVTSVGDNAYELAIDTHIERVFADRPNPDVLDPGDPSLPGWVHGRIDDLGVAIHDQLAAYEVK